MCPLGREAFRCSMLLLIYLHFGEAAGNLTTFRSAVMAE